MTDTQKALDALHQNTKLYLGTYDYQCGYLDAIKDAKAALEAKAVPDGTVTIPKKLYDYLVRYWHNEDVSKDEGYEIREMIQAAQEEK